MRTARLEGHHGWALDRLQNRIRGRVDQRYRRRALLYFEEVAACFYAPQLNGLEAPEYVLDWVTRAEGELYMLLSRGTTQLCTEETSLVQGEVKKKWLKDGGRSRDRRRHSYAKAKAAARRQEPRDRTSGSGTCRVTTSTRVLAPPTKPAAPPPREPPAAPVRAPETPPTTGRSAGSRDRAERLSLDEAADIWSIVLGLANEEEVDPVVKAGLSV